jgi:hypothetical protein
MLRQTSNLDCHRPQSVPERSLVCCPSLTIARLRKFSPDSAKNRDPGARQGGAAVVGRSFSVDGTLVEAWASFKSFRPKERHQTRHDNHSIAHAVVERNKPNVDVGISRQSRHSDLRSIQKRYRKRRRGSGQCLGAPRVGVLILDQWTLPVRSRVTTVCGM